IAQSGWYPSLSLYANYGTGYYYSYAKNPVYPNAPFFNQLEDHSRQVIGLSLNIPIFDRLSTYHQTKIAKLQLHDQQLQYDENIRKLTKEVQQAYAEMIAAEANYKAAKEFYEASKISFEYEKVRFDAGASTQFEFNEVKNRYNQAHAQWVQAKYDYLFKYRIVQLYGN
ncbi:MAG TPA: TolC family protein, partial [Bacteroidales bacterium]|nr:TolC family protein [Bacteroidales bacterium]